MPRIRTNPRASLPHPYGGPDCRTPAGPGNGALLQVLPGRGRRGRPATLAAASLLHAALLLAACTPSDGADPAKGPDPGASGVAEPYVQVVARLGDFIRHEMDDKELPALSIALVDGQETVWSAGFGRRDLDGDRPATSETVYRVGSVSKLFTDMGVMQLVEEGRLDLDAPVGGYLPDIPAGSPLASATLRQLTSHRSGLVREPPVGHYFDDTEPSLAETVRSFAGTRRIYPPEARIKYSNAGIATVGYVLQTVAGRPFAEHLQTAVLEPLGMDRSSFERTAEVEADLADALMWSYHGVSTPAPTFALGMAPAGSMYSTVDDLALFMRELFRIHGGATDGVVSPETLAAMWTPQFSDTDRFQGYGIGFSLSELEGHRRVGHGGAIYGFATTLQALPDEGLGVVAVTDVDIANVVVERVAEAALRMMLAAREGETLAEPTVTGPVDPALARGLDGVYGLRDAEGDAKVRLIERNGQLLMRRSGSSFVSRLRSLSEDTLVVDDRIDFGSRVVVAENGVEVDGTRFEPAPNPRPEPAPAGWEELIGEYGWDHNILYILERDGELRALIEWFFEYPLRRVSDDVWEFGDSGLYPGERLTFLRDAEGRVEGASLEGLVFPRRAVGTEEGETFRIDPVRPVDELREEARAATPPVEEGDFLEPDLVELVTLDPTIRLDIRYAGTNNFMNARFYEEPRAFLQRPAAEGVVRAHRALEPQGYGILVHDGYRPWSVTKMFFDATPEDQKVFVADPADGSRHNRGAAVDLTLFDRATGEPVRMTGGYDEFSDRSYPDYPGGTSRERWHRELLRDVMEDQGFTVYDAEWWHFDFGEWRRYPILDVEFDEIGG